MAALVKSGFCSAYEPHHKTRLDRPAHVRLAARPNTGALQTIIETLNRPALATPRRGHSLAKIARSSQSDSVGCHLQNIVNPLMEKPLMSYWRIPLAGNVTWGSDEVKTKVLRACANFALSEAESYFSDRFGVMTRFLERNNRRRHAV